MSIFCFSQPPPTSGRSGNSLSCLAAVVGFHKLSKSQWSHRGCVVCDPQPWAGWALQGSQGCLVNFWGASPKAGIYAMRESWDFKGAMGNGWSLFLVIFFLKFCSFYQAKPGKAFLNQLQKKTPHPYNPHPPKKNLLWCMCLNSDLSWVFIDPQLWLRYWNRVLHVRT